MLSFKSLLLTFLGIICVNLLIIDFFIASHEDRIVDLKNILVKIPQQTSPKEVLTSANSVCPVSCISVIKEATASIKPSTTTVVQTTTDSSSVKEFFVQLGSGTNKSDDWEDVAGAQAYIDSTKYGSIKTVTFEASVNIPTGNQTAYVRLFNKTDKHPVWFSEMSWLGSKTEFLVSKPIMLDSGNKLYQVQMKSQLKHLINLFQARIHILTY